MKYIFFLTLLASFQSKAIDVCLEPGGQCEDKLVAFLSTANTSLDIAVYQLNLESVVDVIMKKSKKIKIRLLTDADQSEDKKSAIFALIDAKIPVRFGRQKLHMHHKFAIVDGVKMEVGSFNYTKNAATKNQENQLYIDDASTVQTFKDRFEQIWKDSDLPK